MQDLDHGTLLQFIVIQSGLSIIISDRSATLCQIEIFSIQPLVIQSKVIKFDEIKQEYY